MTAATQTLHALNGQMSDAAPTVPADDWFMMGTGCDMMEHVLSLGWNWHSGMQKLPLHGNLPPNVLPEALCAYTKSQKEKAEQARNMLQRAGFLGLQEDNPHPAATPPTKPPGFFFYRECKPQTLLEYSPSVETPPDVGTASDQLLPNENAALEAAPMPPSLLGRTFTEVPQQASNAMPTLRRAFNAGTCPLLSRKVQVSEDTETGAKLAVFSVHEDHIVHSTTRQWVSDAFWVKIHGAPVEFRVQFVAKQVGESKRGLSFKKAKGWGRIELKCVGEPPEGNRFRVSFLAGPGVKHSSLADKSGTITTTAANATAAPGKAARRMVRREAQCSHDFSEYPTFGLNGKDEFWDFSSLVDKKKQAVFIGIEMLPQSDATENKPNLEHAQTCSSEMDVPGDSHTSWSTSPTDDAAEQFQEEPFRFRQVAKAAILEPPPGLELIGLGNLPASN